MLTWPRALAIVSAPVLVALSVVAVAQGVPEGIIMHRMQAGTLDANGWTAASSEPGGFSVELPCLFNDFSTREDVSNAPVLKTYSLGCRRRDQRKFSATRAIYKQGKQGAEEIFSKLQSGSMMENASKILSTFKGFKSVTFEDESNGRCGFLRYVLADADVIVLIVEAPREACGDIRESVDKFFSSLEIADRPAGG